MVLIFSYRLARHRTPAPIRKGAPHGQACSTAHRTKADTVRDGGMMTAGPPSSRRARKRPGRRAVVGTVAVLLAASCCGAGPDDSATPPETAARIVDVVMTDNAFAPDRLRAQRGETVLFRFRNTGSVSHEALFGDAAMQEEHEALMNEPTVSAPSPGPPPGATSIPDVPGTDSVAPGTLPGHERHNHRHSISPFVGPGRDPSASAGPPPIVLVSPGETGELRHTFDQDGDVLIGCHVPGHWATMRAIVVVQAR